MKRTLARVFAIAALAAVYVLAARLGLRLAFFDASVTPVWPPTGISIAALLLGGMWLWPGVLLGAFIANATTDAGAATAAGIAVGNTLEAVAGVWAVHHFCAGREVFVRPGTVFRYLVLVAGLSTALSATIGAISLCLADPAKWEQFSTIWLTWWTGDAVSAVIVVPLIVVWFIHPLPALARGRLVEGAALLLAAVVTGLIAFGAWRDPAQPRMPIGFLMIPVLLWGALRFGHHGAASVGVLFAAIAIGGTLQGFGAFALGDPNTGLLLLQGFMGTLALSALMVAAVETRRQHAMIALAGSEAESSAVFELAGSGKALVDTASGRFMRVNRKLCEITGYTRDELLRFAFNDITHEEDRTWSAREAQRMMRGEIPEYRAEKRYVRKDGQVIWVNVTATLVSRGTGLTPLAAGVVQDITAAKQAAEKLRESEERFRALADNIAQLAWMADELGLATWYNQRWYDYTGTTLEEMRGEGWKRLHHPDHLERVQRSLRSALAAGTVWEDTFPLRGRDGAYRWFLSRAVPIRDDDGKVRRWFGTNTDITAQREVEEELLRHREHLEQLIEERTAELERSHAALRLSERMAALGTLAAGLGHDMGNLLLPIKARLDVLQHSALPAEAGEHLAAIAQCANYLQALTRGLRLFARDPQQDVAGETTDLTRWAAEVSAFFESVLSREIQFRAEIAEGLPRAAIAPHSLTQCVLNLINNAKDALATTRGGAVTLAARLEPGGERVRVLVRDNGPGMSAEVRDRALEPFFTTKTRGISTGLGLSLVHGIVSAAGGEVTIESAPGKGTAISVVLPVATGPQEPDEGDQSRGSVALSIADPRRCALLLALLSSLGYTVSRAEGAAPVEADLWFTDTQAARPDAARRFLAGGAQRRVVIVGEAADEWRELAAASIPQRINLQSVREALAAARRSAAPVPSAR